MMIIVLLFFLYSLLALYSRSLAILRKPLICGARNRTSLVSRKTNSCHCPNSVVLIWCFICRIQARPSSVCPLCLLYHLMRNPLVPFKYAIKGKILSFLRAENYTIVYIHHEFSTHTNDWAFGLFHIFGFFSDLPYKSFQWIYLS